MIVRLLYMAVLDRLTVALIEMFVLSKSVNIQLSKLFNYFIHRSSVSISISGF